MNSYTKTKQFTEWLDKVKPEFEIKSGQYFVDHYGKRRPFIVDDTARDEFGYAILCSAITTDSLHSILWELFEVQNMVYTDALFMTEAVKTFANPSLNQLEEYFYYKGVMKNEPQVLADALWQKYTAGKESKWLTNPDSVLDDIMKVYNDEMNR